VRVVLGKESQKTLAKARVLCISLFFSKTNRMQGDVWSVWLSGVSVPADSVEFYARQLAAHNIESDQIHRLTPHQLVAIGFAPSDAEQTVKKKAKKKKKKKKKIPE
jgi:hypothetical protein